MAKLQAYAGPFLVVVGLGLLLAHISTDAGGLLAVLGFLLWLRRLRHPLPPKLARALEIQSTDPATGRRLLDEYWAAAGGQERERRAELLRRAHTDAGAAQELRKRLLEDLKLNEAARARSMGEGASPNLAADVDRNLRHQLEQLDAIVRSLPPE